ncbi:MAG: hypothetical protein IJS28_07460 [Synergistaceae bacterium]|nr:hypothetical protein [Synergistaceae bacterium]
MSFRDSFGNEYLDTCIPDKIVGFTGIDPSLIPNIDTEDIVGGEDEHPVAWHDSLEEILGGDDDGCYHLTHDEYEKLVLLLNERYGENDDDEGDAPEDNNRTLTAEEYAMLSRLLSEVYGEEGDDPVFPLNLADEELTELIDNRIAEYLSSTGVH